jgi:hypothetical protein
MEIMATVFVRWGMETKRNTPVSGFGDCRIALSCDCVCLADCLLMTEPPA